MATESNGRYNSNVHEGAFNAGLAFGIALKHDLAPVALLGADLAFRVVSQVLLDRGQAEAAGVVDQAVFSFVRGYQYGKSQSERP